MLITIDRAWKKDVYTITRLYVNGELFVCNTLEDTDRGLRQDMQLEEIKKKKKNKLITIITIMKSSSNEILMKIQKKD